MQSRPGPGGLARALARAHLRGVSREIKISKCDEVLDATVIDASGSLSFAIFPSPD